MGFGILAKSEVKVPAAVYEGEACFTSDYKIARSRRKIPVSRQPPTSQKWQPATLVTSSFLVPSLSLLAFHSNCFVLYLETANLFGS
jgi:hypothetical protein